MLVLKDVTLLDGSNEPVHHANVLIKGERILEAGAICPIPEDAKVLDLQGSYVIPGLIDAHTHFGGSISFERPPHTGRFVSYDYAQHREAALQWGVTTVRSAGDFMPDIIEIRELANSGQIRSPRIFTAGRMIQATGGHPWNTVFFQNPETAAHELIFADLETDLEREVSKLVEDGVDWIKLYISEDDVIHWPQKLPRLSDCQLRKATDTAHRLGKPVMAHVDNFDGMRLALDAGVDSIEHTLNNGANHGLSADEIILNRLVKQGVWVVPTMVATKYHDGSIPQAEPVMPRLICEVGKLIQAGVKLGVGCDSGIPMVPYGKCVHEELQLLCQAGMTPAQALYAATHGNAVLLGWSDQIGTFHPGSYADLIVLGSDPYADISNTQDIQMVLQSGKIVIDHILSL